MNRPEPLAPATTVRDSDVPGPPRESLGHLFLRFLRFGLLAWGGPVPQIAMIRHDLVERERWISPEKFNRVLAVYQALPGPEAHELCCYFGMLARGRLGALLAGLGFMLPGLILMLALSWAYVEYGIESALAAALFAGVQPVVAALIVRAVHTIGKHTAKGPLLLGIAASCAVMQALQVHFAITLVLAAAAGVAGKAVKHAGARAALLLALGAIAITTAVSQGRLGLAPQTPADAEIITQPANLPEGHGSADNLTLFTTGLKGGLLTFGGAYTAIPVVEREAVREVRAAAGLNGQPGWMSREQFVDGLALSGVLPAPLVIFSTFVGYLGGGFVGALLATLGMFLPAFAFTLIGHDLFERAVNQRALHAALDGVAAGVTGLIAITAVGVIGATVKTPGAAIIFGVALASAYAFKGKAVTPLVILGGALAGLVLARG